MPLLCCLSYFYTMHSQMSLHVHLYCRCYDSLSQCVTASSWGGTPVCLPALPDQTLSHQPLLHMACERLVSLQSGGRSSAKIIGSACILHLLVIAYHLTWGHSIHVSYDQVVLRPAARHVYLVPAQHWSSLIEFCWNCMRTCRDCVWERDFMSLRREVTAD